MDYHTVSRLSERISDLLANKLSVSGRTLSQRSREAGPMLPRRTKADLAILVEALEKTEDPRVAMQIDPAHVMAAYRRCLKFLQSVDPNQDRITRRYRLAAVAMFQILAVSVVTIWVLRHQGYL
ncbi:MAG: hypothetical protein AAGA12_12810 [Pseudomonadota bacterium]